MPESVPPEQMVRHSVETRLDLTVNPVAQLLRRLPHPRSAAELHGEASAWSRAQKAQARDHAPELGLLLLSCRESS